MALVQLVVALCFLALSLGNKDIKTGFTSSSVSKSSTPQNKTGQQRAESEEKHNRFVRWALNSATDEFNAVPFAPDEEQENARNLLDFLVRRSPEMPMAPPLDKIAGGFYTRELSEPAFDGLESFRGQDFGINRRFALQNEFIPTYSAMKDTRRKRSDPQTNSKLTQKATLVKRMDKIDRVGFRPPYLGGKGRSRTGGFQSFKKKSGSGYHSWQKKNFDEIDRSGFNNLKKRNFDEIDRAGFHSLGRRNFDEFDRAGFNSLGKRNFDEFDRAGFNSLGKRNFDEIDKSRFRDLGKRDFDEIDRSGFQDFGKRNFDEIDRSGFRGFGKRSSGESDTQGLLNASVKNSLEAYKDENSELGKRNFDEIDRSGFRSFSKRSTSGEKLESSA